MYEKIREKVDVLTLYTNGHAALPMRVRWRGKIFKITELGFRHKEWEGKDLYLVYSATDGNSFFRLKHDVANESWTLDEVSDGIAD